MQNIGGGGTRGIVGDVQMANSFNLRDTYCRKQDGRMRKKGFIYPGIFLRFLDILFLMRSCKASNLESERHFIVFFR